jgi:polyisoprenoid-binding protein YceI
MRKLTATVLAGAVALATFTTLHAQGAAPQLPGQADVGRVEAGTYKVDSNHSMVGWKLNHFGFNDYFGIFGDVAGTITADPANPSASTVDVTIPIASVVVPSSALRDHLLRAGSDGKAPDFFGPDPAPARFVSTSIEPTGGTSANIVGDLTMNGVTKPVTIAAEFAGAGANPMSRVATIGFHGQAVIKRSDFNVSFGIPFGLSDEVPLDITVAAEKQ